MIAIHYSYAAGVSAAAFVAFNRALVGTAIRLAAIPLGIVAIAVALEDLSVWMRGGDSLIGRKFGPFAAALDDIKAKIDGLVPGLKELGSATGAVDAPTVKTGGIAQVVSDLKRDMDLMSGAMRSMGEYVGTNWVPGIVAAVRSLVTSTVEDRAEIKAAVGHIGAAFVGAAGLIKDNWGSIEAFFRQLATSVGSQFRNMLADGHNLMRVLVGIPGIIAAAWNAIPEFMDKVWRDVQEVWNKMQAGAEAVGRALGSVLPAPLPGGPSLNGVPIPNFNPGVGPASFIPDVSNRMGRIASNSNITINSPVNNNFPITATGVSGAEVAAAANRGVGQAMDRSGSRGEALARALGVAMPRTEAAAS